LSEFVALSPPQIMEENKPQPTNQPARLLTNTFYSRDISDVVRVHV